MQEATDYAKQQADVFKNSLQYLIDQQNEQKKNAQQLVTQNYENMINQLNQSKVPIEEQYKENARQAYVNKVLAGKKLESDLTRLGLDTTGFALTQKIYNENQYSANLNQLALDRAAGLRGVDDDIANARGQLASDLLKVEVDYADRLTQLNQYINNQVNDKYNDAYDMFFTNKQYEDKLKQQEWENQMAEQERLDRLEQQKIENQQNWYNLYQQNSGGGFGGDGDLDVEDTEEEMRYHQGNNQATRNKDDYFFKNSMQPRYIENQKLTTSGMFSQDLVPFLTKLGSSLSEFGAVENQNIWRREDGTYWLWSNTPDEDGNLYYNDITTLVKQYLKSDYTKEKLAKKENSKPKVDFYVSYPFIGVAPPTDSDLQF